MADDPPRIREQSTEPYHDTDSSCPFCTITSAFQPIPPAETENPDWNPDRLSPPTYVLLSTEHVVAFLDIAPLTRGHVLLTPRKHRVKIGNCSLDEAAEVSAASLKSQACETEWTWGFVRCSGWEVAIRVATALSILMFTSKNDAVTI